MSPEKAIKRLEQNACEPNDQVKDEKKSVDAGLLARYRVHLRPIVHFYSPLFAIFQHKFG